MTNALIITLCANKGKRYPQVNEEIGVVGTAIATLGARCANVDTGLFTRAIGKGLGQRAA